ncbi:Protein Mpv17 [Coemansia sp. RSA 485]|nr:Protein Mpv17 [Coemansia sp. RSA 485]
MQPLQTMSERLVMALKRVAVDQTVFAPFATGVFVFGMGALEGLDTAGLVQRAKTQYMDILTAGYALWPAAQLINFSFVPLVYRVPFGSTVSLFWNTYLGWKNCQAKRIESAQIAMSYDTVISDVKPLESRV